MRHHVIALSFFLLVSEFAFGQTFEMPGNGPVPTLLMINPETKQPWKVWVAYEGYRPRRSYKMDTEVPGTRLRFMQPLFVAYEYQDPEARTQFLFLAKSDASATRVDEPIGWVPKNVIVTKQAAEIDPATSIHLKARIVNKLAHVITALGNPDDEATESDLSQAAVRLAPTEDAEIRTHFRLSNLFFVYAQTETHVLMGAGPYFLDKPEDVVLGWVANSRVSRWNTREAFEWDRQTTLPTAEPRRITRAAVLDDAESAESWLNGQPLFSVDPELADDLDDAKIPQGLVEEFEKLGKSLSEDAAVFVGAKKTRWLLTDDGGNLAYTLWLQAARINVYAFNIAFEEVFGDDEISRAFRYDEPRMPVLGTVKRDIRTQNRLYRVGWVGGFVGGDVDLPVLRQQLRNAQESLKNLDILFVIDDSVSMKDYFPIVGDCLQTILKSIDFYEDRNVRVAVSYYGDVDFSDEPFETSKLADVRNRPEMDKIIAETRSHVGQGGGDAPESVFEGIRKAIDEAGFKPYAQKLVIVIGDMGDKSGDDPGDVEKSKVVQKLFPAGMPIEFCAVHTEQRDRNPSVQRHPDAVRFETHMRGIARLANARDQESGEIASYIHSSQTNDVRQRLVDRYAQLQKVVSEVSEGVRKWQRGEWNTDIGPAVKRRLRVHGVDVEKFQRMKGSEIYQEGFIWHYARGPGEVPQLRERVLIEKSGVEEIVRILEKLVGKRPSGFVKASISQLVREEVERITGDVDAGGSLDDVFFKEFGLHFKSPLLRLPEDELSNFTVKTEHVQYLESRLLRLKDVLANRISDWHLIPQKTEAGDVELKWVFTEQSPEKRDFTIEGDPLETQWYWLDLQEELP